LDKGARITTAHLSALALDIKSDMTYNKTSVFIILLITILLGSLCTMAPAKEEKREK
jgi:hypothetical protein